MGYESKFYIIEKNNHFLKNDKGFMFAQCLACFKMSKMGSIEWLSRFPKTDYFIYADDGNTEIINDEYGDPLIEIPINDLIEIIENDEELKEYRRTAPFLALLKGFDQSKFPYGLAVLHYGY